MAQLLYTGGGGSGSSCWVTLQLYSETTGYTAKLYRNGSFVKNITVSSVRTPIGDLTGLNCSTTYEWYVYTPPSGSNTNSIYTLAGKQTSGGGSGGDEEEELENNTAIYAKSVTVSTTGYDSSTGYASINFNIKISNPNSDSVCGRITATVTDGTTTRTYSETIDNNRWIDHNDIITISYDWYMGGAEKTFTVKVNCHCYINPSLSYCRSGVSYGDMASSGNITFNNLKVSISNYRPDKFYWISSSTRLNDASHKGKPISDYITATKWKALQTNVNAVRVYRGLSNYSFTTNITSGVTPITAALYNEIANAINGIKSGTVSTVTKGVTPITTSVMMALQDGINGIT